MAMPSGKHRFLSAVVWAAILGLTGCTDTLPNGQQISPSPLSSSSSPFPSVVAAVDCGQDDGHPSGQGYNATARTCLWQNYQGAHPATFLTIVYGVEGSKTNYELTVPGSGGVDVVRRSDGTVWRFHCQKLERQDNTYGYRIGLLLTECQTFTFVGLP